MIKVMIVDDHPVVRIGIAALIAADPEFSVVAAEGTVAGASVKYRELQPDVTLVDLALGEESGFDLWDLIRRDFPQARGLVYSADATPASLTESMLRGIQGYLLKGASAATLQRAIREVHQGGEFWAEEVDALRQAAGEMPRLTPRELDVLRCVARGASNKQVAIELGIAPNTVVDYLNTVRTKLEARNRTEAVLTALQSGLIRLGKAPIRTASEPGEAGEASDS